MKEDVCQLTLKFEAFLVTFILFIGGRFCGYCEVQHSTYRLSASVEPYEEYFPPTQPRGEK